MPDLETEIMKNIAARENAAEAMHDIRGYAHGVDEERFWECVASMAAAKVGRLLSDDGPARFSMTEEEAIRFEKRVISLPGIHRGKLVRDVSAESLASLAENPFARELRRYTQSDHFKRKVGILPPMLANGVATAR